MEILLGVFCLIFGVHQLRLRDQRQRIALLGHHLSKYPIEKLMQTLTEGYLQALEQADAQARDQAWGRLAAAETELSTQLSDFVQAFSQVWSDRTQVSTLPVVIP